jgi:predicted dehydrogenase
VTLYSTEGGVELFVRDYGYDNTVRAFTDTDGSPVDIAPRLPKGQGHLHVIERFVAAVLDGAAPTPGAKKGLRRVEVIAACYESAPAGREIAIADPSTSDR